MSPIISVLIANFNGEHVLPECMESVLLQEGAPQFEIIIHDDASQDDSLSVLESIRTKHKEKEIRIIESTENSGFCVANNRMAKQARGDFLLLLNNDATLAPDALRTLLDTARAQATKGILTLPQIDHQSGELVDRGCLLDPFYNPIPNKDLEIQEVGMAIGACMWIPRQLWEQLGGFPEWFESIGEDLYLCCRARLLGRTVQVATHSHYRHHQGASFGGNRIKNNRIASTFRRRRLSERNKTYVLILCSPSLRLWLTLPLHLTLLAIEGMTLAAIERRWMIWTEIYANVFVNVFRNRARLQSERKNILLTRTLTARGYSKAFRLFPRKLQMLLLHGIPTLK